LYSVADTSRHGPRAGIGDHPGGVQHDLAGEADDAGEVTPDVDRPAPQRDQRIEERAAQRAARGAVGVVEAFEEEFVGRGELQALGTLARPRPPQQERADVIEALDVGQVPGVARGESRELTAERPRAGLECADVPRAPEPDGARAVRAAHGVDLGLADPRWRGCGHRPSPPHAHRAPPAFSPFVPDARLAN
jgi:hypothetical protein